jgi:hypothetical protein
MSYLQRSTNPGLVVPSASASSFCKCSSISFKNLLSPSGPLQIVLVVLSANATFFESHATSKAARFYGLEISHGQDDAEVRIPAEVSGLRSGDLVALQGIPGSGRLAPSSEETPTVNRFSPPPILRYLET